MNNYNLTSQYFEKGYYAPNVESITFRLQAKILKHEYNLPIKNETNLLDFGCGQGASTNFFNNQGYNVIGVDISKTDIEIAKKNFPNLSNKFHIVDSDPKVVDYYGFKENIDVVYALQSLYYFTKEDFYTCINKIYLSLKKGAFFFATFKTPNQFDYYNNSKPTEDPWLREVKFNNGRINIHLKQFFIEDKEDLINRLKIFKPIHLGSYTMQLRNDESPGEHLTFFGIKE